MGYILGGEYFDDNPDYVPDDAGIIYDCECSDWNTENDEGTESY